MPKTPSVNATILYMYVIQNVIIHVGILPIFVIFLVGL